MTSDRYEVYAIKYAELAREARSNFVDGDLHETADMPLFYYVWVIRNAARTIVVDTGFGETVGQRRGRTITKPVAAGLNALGVDAGETPRRRVLPAFKPKPLALMRRIVLAAARSARQAACQT